MRYAQHVECLDEIRGDIIENFSLKNVNKRDYVTDLVVDGTKLLSRFLKE
jgi:hypothetical protein